MAEYTTDELMIVNAARHLGALAAAGKPQCFVGIGLPSTAANLARRLYPIEPVLIYESGCIGSKPTRLPLSIGDGELAETSDAVVSVPEIFAYWLQAGRIDIGFLSGAQLDKFANINSTVIGVVRVAEDPPAGCRRCAGDRRVGRRGDGDHAPVGASVRRALRLPHVDRLRRRQGRSRAIRSARWRAAVGHHRPRRDGARSARRASSSSSRLHPGVTREQVIAATGWAVRFADDLATTDEPTDAELDDAARAAGGMNPFTYDQLAGADRVRRRSPRRGRRRGRAPRRPKVMLISDGQATADPARRDRRHSSGPAWR